MYIETKILLPIRKQTSFWSLLSTFLKEALVKLLIQGRIMKDYTQIGGPSWSLIIYHCGLNWPLTVLQKIDFGGEEESIAKLYWFDVKDVNIVIPFSHLPCQQEEVNKMDVAIVVSSIATLLIKWWLGLVQYKPPLNAFQQEEWLPAHIANLECLWILAYHTLCNCTSRYPAIPRIYL